MSIASAHAETLASFTPKGFTQGGPSPWDEVAAPDTVELHPGVELWHGLERGKGLSKGGTADAWGGSGWAAVDATAAVTEEDYFTVTLAPQTGNALSFSGIESVMFRGKTSATSYLWQYRIGFGEFVDIGEPTILNVASMSAAQEKVHLNAIPALQKVTGPVTFRMVGWGAAAKSASWGFGKTKAEAVLEFEGTVNP